MSSHVLVLCSVVFFNSSKTILQVNNKLVLNNTACIDNFYLKALDCQRPASELSEATEFFHLKAGVGSNLWADMNHN